MLGANILLIDTSETFFDDTVNAFSKIGIDSTLSFAKSNNEAWSLLHGTRKLTPLPKIILIDINANKVNGVELITKIRKDAELKSILIYVVTDVSNIDNKRAALNLNIAGYMHKPTKKQEIVNFFSILNDYWNSIEFSS